MTNTPDAAAVVERKTRDRPWSDYPIGTKAHSVDGGYWIRVVHGWKWCTGDTFPTPGGSVYGRCIEMIGAAMTPTPTAAERRGE